MEDGWQGYCDSCKEGFTNARVQGAGREDAEERTQATDLMAHWVGGLGRLYGCIMLKHVGDTLVARRHNTIERRPMSHQCRQTKLQKKATKCKHIIHAFSLCSNRLRVH